MVLLKVWLILKFDNHANIYIYLPSHPLCRFCHTCTQSIDSQLTASIPSVSHQPNAINIAAHRGRQKHDAICNLLRQAQSSQRRFLGMVMQRMGFILGAMAVVDHRRLDVARADGVDANVGASVGGSVSLGHSHDGC